MKEKDMVLIMVGLMMVKILYKANNEVKVYYEQQLMAVNVYGKVCHD